ncbi:MAG: D-alanyl-D-alanine carboxypeptidase family protein [Gudongella sp.]|nr:D-alanyl-D-alanine carboxypeptidase family protein [Gudongella sp.]
MKRFIYFFAILFFLFIFDYTYAETLDLSGEAAILIDYDTNEILYEKNSHLELYPASTTKMMTAILAVENSELDELVTIDDEIVSLTYGSHIALEPGEVLTMEQLLHAMLLPSANDAALAIAKHVGGTIDNFVSMMNQRAVELGANDTNFVNPNGLHDDNHVSSAYDLALIGKEAMEHEQIRNIVNTVQYEIPPTNKKTESRYFKITNKLLYDSELINVDGKLISTKYPYASGVKTGYTSNAKNCLVAYANKADQKLISVVLKADGINVYADTHKLLNYGFENFNNIIIANSNEFIDNISITDGDTPYIAGILDRNIVYPMSEFNQNNIEKKITIREDLKAPIDKGQIIGEAEYLIDGKVIGGGNIISTAAVLIDPDTTTFGKIKNNWYLFIFLIAILLRIYTLALRRKRKKMKSRQTIYRMPYNAK